MSKSELKQSEINQAIANASKLLEMNPHDEEMRKIRIQMYKDLDLIQITESVVSIGLLQFKKALDTSTYNLRTEQE